MQRFYFHVTADDLRIPDLVGIDLKDTAAARHHAETQLTEIWALRVLTGPRPTSGWLDVVDSEERAVLSLPL